MIDSVNADLNIFSPMRLENLDAEHDVLTSV